jgi:hypothetical protein
MQESSTATRRRIDGIVFTTMVGKPYGHTIERMRQDVFTIWRPTDRIWLVDTTKVPSFDPSIAGPAGILLTEIKKREGVVIAIITNAFVRSMGSALCFAAGVKLIPTTTLRAAEAEIEKHLNPSSS